MATKNINLYFLSIDMKADSKYHTEFNPKVSFISLLNYIYNLNLKNRKEEYIESNQVIYLDTYECDTDTINLIFKSAKYNHVRNVIDTVTMIDKPQKKKTPQEGDVETTHMVIKFSDNSIDAIIEYSHYGARENKIFQYLNDKIKKISETESTSLSDISYKYYFNTDFLEMLYSKDKQDLRKVQLSCDDTSDDFLALSGRNNQYDKVICVQPKERGWFIPKNDIEKFYKDFESGKYTRIKVLNSDSKTIIDTKNIKKNIQINVELNIDGTVKSPLFFREIKKRNLYKIL